MNTKKLGTPFVLLFGLCASACEGDSHNEALSTLKPSTAGLSASDRLDTVQELATERGKDAPLGDEPAELAFKRVAGLSLGARASATPLAVYELEEPGDPIGHLSERARQLAVPFTAEILMEGRNVPDRADAAMVIGDFVRVSTTFDERPWALQYDTASGAEHFFDREAFHVGFGDIDKPDHDAYVRAARAFLARTQAAVPQGMHLYKVREYKNGSDSEGAPSVESTYQVAVAFNGDIGGVPVIGSGGKVAVHLGNGARPVSYETSHVPVRAKHKNVPVTELISAEDAEAQAWARLAELGLGPQTHTLTSRQFGYLRRNRNSIQTLIAPSYAFFFMPTVDPGKKRVEVISAVADPELKAELEADAELDRARKRRGAMKADARL